MNMYIENSTRRGRGAPIKADEEKSYSFNYSIKIKSHRKLIENCKRLGYKHYKKVEEGIEFFNILCDSIEAQRLEISRLEFEIKERNELITIIKTNIEKTIKMDDKAAHRFEDSIYLLEIQRIADDIRRHPEKEKYIPERAGRIAPKYELLRHIVVQDILNILAGQEFTIPDITKIHDMLKEEVGL